ncbi:hypothetical protein GCM10009069_28180 [Algimonas arctica]|uniref:DDE domain-containing protein n=1 Tax=Algimonas arctica TaxID=1479486 RepID=A0A8J3G3Q6_9PROT|nr:hypothetical protein [Algimonas arctica]GHB03949.1 hypothetical protein GCM10009069_28180 [Algimonas arctica]
MRQSKTTSGERTIKDIKRKTRKQYSAEEKIRIVLGGVLECNVTKKRNKLTALMFLKIAMKRYGPPLMVVTDRLRPYGARCAISAIRTDRIQSNTSTTEPRIHIDRSGVESAP